MSATPPTDPKDSKDPKEAPKSDLASAVIWTVLATIVAAGLIYYSTLVEPEKKNFYLIGATLAAILGCVNAYYTWTAYNKAKQPPAAPQ
jgi:hypothetical protein